jgi:hypothetical protein
MFYGYPVPPPVRGRPSVSAQGEIEEEDVDLLPSCFGSIEYSLFLFGVLMPKGEKRSGSSFSCYLPKPCFICQIFFLWLVIMIQVGFNSNYLLSLNHLCPMLCDGEVFYYYCMRLGYLCMLYCLSTICLDIHAI